MKKALLFLLPIFMITEIVNAQTEPDAGHWKTWLISSGKDFRLPQPAPIKNQVQQVIASQQKINRDMMQKIVYWNAGAPGYRWYDMMGGLYVKDTTSNGRFILASMVLHVAIYDATIAAWDTKYAYNRLRPFAADKRIRLYIPDPASPSYPCERSVAAGVAVTVISHFFPELSDSVHKMAKELMVSRIAAGVAFPEDTKAGFELGKKIAEKEIERTNDFAPVTVWDYKMPDKPGIWKGKFAMYVMAGHNKTMFLDSASQFRPGPPPDYAKDMAELKNYKQTFRSLSNAFFWASQPFWDDALDKKIFEYGISVNPPRAARLYALTSIGLYDGFIACWDAKYTYWGTRPDQYDTTFKPAIFNTPPFPGYPSGHASVSGIMGELYSYFFPEDAAYFRKKAKDGAESRFQAGIHFRTDNEVGLDLGRKIASIIIEKAKTDGSEQNSNYSIADNKDLKLTTIKK